MAREERETSAHRVELGRVDPGNAVPASECRVNHTGGDRYVRLLSDEVDKSLGQSGAAKRHERRVLRTQHDIRADAARPLFRVMNISLTKSHQREHQRHRNGDKQNTE